MNIFLYSLSVDEKQIKVLKGLLGNSKNNITVGLIENAADVVTEGPEGWLEEIRKTIIGYGFQLHLIDLREFVNDEISLREKMNSVDIIWVGGGNMYYLRYLLQKTRADKIIKELIESGKVYCGWSAGGCVVGPTLLDGENMDDISKAPELIYDGIYLVDFVMIPHIDNEYYSIQAKEWSKKLEARKIKTVELMDNQAIIVEDNIMRII
jgi:dipeptidase E